MPRLSLGVVGAPLEQTALLADGARCERGEFRFEFGAQRPVGAEHGGAKHVSHRKGAKKQGCRRRVSEAGSGMKLGTAPSLGRRDGEATVTPLKPFNSRDCLHRVQPLTSTNASFPPP